MGRLHRENGGRFGATAGIRGGILQISNGPLIYPGMVIATGGTVTDITIGGISYRVHTFTATGNHTFTVTNGGEVEYLIVGGGGGASGHNSSGGGGAGGFRTNVAGAMSGGGAAAEP